MARKKRARRCFSDAALTADTLARQSQTFAKKGQCPIAWKFVEEAEKSASGIKDSKLLATVAYARETAETYCPAESFAGYTRRRRRRKRR